MTSPQDPNQPVDPGAAPGGAAPQGWGQQPPAQPGWGAPPPTQPGWGAPPPTQPGWGAPPPAGGQPGWGAPPQGAQPGWGQPPAAGWGAPPKKGHGCLIAFLIVVGAIVFVGGCTALVLGPMISKDIKLTQDLGTNRVSSVSFNSTNGVTTWVIHLKAGYDTETEANTLACTIVKPDLGSDHFELVDSDGFELVNDYTLVCP